MPVTSSRYDSFFSPEERKRIAFLRSLDRNRTLLAWLVGAATAVTIFFIQVPFHGNALLHAVCSYGSAPIGIAIGSWLYFFIDRYTDREFLIRWDPLFYERSNTTPDRLAAQEEVLQLTEDMHFIALPLEQQRLIVNGVYRKWRLPEPNPTSAEKPSVQVPKAK